MLKPGICVGLSKAQGTWREQKVEGWQGGGNKMLSFDPDIVVENVNSQ